MNFIEKIKIGHEFVEKQNGFKYMRLLSMIYVTFLMAATIMAYKLVNIWGVTEPGSTLIYTFTFFWAMSTPNYMAQIMRKN